MRRSRRLRANPHPNAREKRVVRLEAEFDFVTVVGLEFEGDVVLSLFGERTCVLDDRLKAHDLTLEVVVVPLQQRPGAGGGQLASCLQNGVDAVVRRLARVHRLLGKSAREAAELVGVAHGPSSGWQVLR